MNRLKLPDARQVDEIFSAALDLDGQERERFLDERCDGLPQLRVRIDALLAVAGSDDDTITESFRQVREAWLETLIASDPELAAEDLTGETVGAWRLERLLARGGLGTVYVARRADGEYEQRVAFKVLRRGLDTDDLVTRFRAERQILSALEHPGIARLIDGGALADGRPFLVMEYIDGVPLTEYCVINELGPAACVRLFRSVLDALHHAHQHLVVHRDIKPTNILVSKTGSVVLLDFGIAKLLDPEAMSTDAPETRLGTALMTPAYSSPEQMSGGTVTTASDIYQAGVLLSELLSGQRVTVGEPVPAAVHADLRAIIAKAVRAEPERRYASAADMNADLERFLSGRPVLARPDSLTYRLGKFMRRRPWAMPAVALGFLAIVAYVVTLTAYANRLKMEQQRATAAQEFLVQLLSGPDPFRSEDPEFGRDLTVVDALDLGLARISHELDTDPVLGAAVLDSAAQVYASLDQHEKAIAVAERATTLPWPGAKDRNIRRQRLLAEQYRLLGNYDKAQQLYDRQLHEALGAYAPGDPEIGLAQVAAADMQAGRGETGVARQLYRKGIENLRRGGDLFRLDLVYPLMALARSYRFEDSGRAMSLVDEAVRIALEEKGEASLAFAAAVAEKASVYSAMGKYASAETAFMSAIPIFEAELGRTHRQTLSTINNLGILYNRMQQPKQAEDVYAEVLQRFREKYGEAHRDVANSYQNLATALTRQGKYRESIPMHQKAHDLYAAILPTTQPVQAYPLISKAYAELRLERAGDAERTAAAAVTILAKTGTTGYAAGVAQCLLGRALEKQGRDGAPLLAAARDKLAGSTVSADYREICLSRD